MQKKKNKDITTLGEILDAKYGKRGAVKREQWEEEFETFRLGVLLEEARIKMEMTQQELADQLQAHVKRDEALQRTVVEIGRDALPLSLPRLFSVITI